MKKYFSILLLLYAFMVALRIVGQLINKTAINWKSTLFLGELDNTEDYGQRWKARIATMIAFPFVWNWLKENKWIG